MLIRTGRSIVVLRLLIAALIVASAASVRAQSARPEAPDFPAGVQWLNTDRPLSMRELRGKVVLLDFWTYG